MKRKIIALCVVVAMMAIAIVGSTMAYFTDTDHAVNVMVLGNIEVGVYELQRDGYGGYEEFVSHQELMPAVYTGTGTAFNEYDYDGFWTNVNNAIDKIVVVSNTGKSEAYFRTFIAFEEPMNMLAYNMSSALTDTGIDIEIDGSDYSVYCCEYYLDAGDSTGKLLTQFAVLPAATQADCAGYGATYEILTLTQAVQAKGFSDASTALKEGFGEVTEANVQSWFGVVEIPTMISTAADLRAALTAGESVVLEADLDLDADTTVTINAGEGATLDLNGHTITAVSESSSGNREAFLVKGNLTVKNGTVTIEHEGADMGWGAMTSVFDVTAGGVLNLENAVIRNLGGSSMAFCVHLNNWGEVTLSADNVVFDSTYMAIRVFNSGYDMNNVTVTNSTLKGKYGYWVHNYTAADFGTQEKADAQKLLLNVDIFNGTNTFDTTVAPGILGFTDSIKLDANGNPM